MSTQNIEGVTLMDGEEIAHDLEPHRLHRWQKGLSRLFAETRYIVTTERVIVYKETFTGNETREYPIRDIQQLQTEASNAQQLFNTGTITFSVGGAGDKIELEWLPNHRSVANVIRERQRELADS